MITADSIFQSMIDNPVRHIKARVELYNGSTLVSTYSYNDKLVSFTVERTGENKFFGFSICQKLNLKLLDIERDISVSTANSIKIQMGVEDSYIYTFPEFFITEVHRDEKTNQLSITAYDKLYSLAQKRIDSITLPDDYTLLEFINAVCAETGLNAVFSGFADEGIFSTLYEGGANLDGAESLRECLTAVAEVANAILYINHSGELVFKFLDMDGEAVYTINRERYFTLDSSTNRRLATLCYATELGDNLAASIAQSGSTHYVRNNPFLDMRDDTAEMLEAALAIVGGFSVNQFNCNWRGNFLIELGDKIALITKDGATVYSYLIDDTVSYDGSFSQVSKWQYKDNDGESAANATTLGEALKQTYAKVDKVNRQIEILASEENANSENISNILINTESITQSVSRIEETTESALETMNNEIATLSNKVSQTITADNLKIEVATQISSGVDKVKTNMGYTFDDEGLTVAKSESDLTTQITENGMRVYKGSETVLTANNIGVEAANLHATTYLIIGNNSRIEDYDGRTGIFWIGEVSS